MNSILQEIEKEFFVYISYYLDKHNQETSFLHREIMKKFTLLAINPFILRTRAKILNHFYNNIYKMENIGGKASHLLLPANQKCNILYYLTPPSNNIVH